MNNELLKKNAIIDEMEPKYNASCEFGLTAEMFEALFSLSFPCQGKSCGGGM